MGPAETLRACRPFVLIVPTYCGEGGKGAVPKQVIRFLNDAENRAHIRGVIAAGNSNFGDTYGIAGDVDLRQMPGALPLPVRAPGHAAGCR